jgi:DivIVA domain-containing protein
MSLVFVVVGIAVIAAAFWYATGRWSPELPRATHDLRPAERDREPTFDVVLRGYRMDEVDATIADLRQQIDELQARG